ncbi:MAG TPA: iron ABC transporter permease [Vicinamibacterales bacterium]|nr:iron ABC transporter permease [Vicinamibacterales bacterium]
MSAPRIAGLLLALVVLMILTVLASIRFGAIDFPLHQMWSSTAAVLAGRTPDTLDGRIFTELRLPRAILCVFVGASLGVGGTLMQALFRNPIVEPGLVGTSSGAAFGASLYFVLGTVLHVEQAPWSLPAAACAGGVVSTWMVFALAETRGDGRASIVMLLLTGLAVNALFLSGIGFLSYIARDPQARSIIFWNLGTLSGATWRSVAIVGGVTTLGTLASLVYAKQLNALMIGEEEATYLGVNVARLKLIVLSINVAIVAVATAFTGVISFVGLIVPHILRMLRGADNRFLIIASAVFGATLLSLADLIARVALRPAELPIGIVTSVVGVPVFLSLLRRRRYVF